MTNPAPLDTQPSNKEITELSSSNNGNNDGSTTKDTHDRPQPTSKRSRKKSSKHRTRNGSPITRFGTSTGRAHRRPKLPDQFKQSIANSGNAVTMMDDLIAPRYVLQVAGPVPKSAASWWTNCSGRRSPGTRSYATRRLHPEPDSTTRTHGCLAKPDPCQAVQDLQQRDGIRHRWDPAAKISGVHHHPDGRGGYNNQHNLVAPEIRLEQDRERI